MSKLYITEQIVKEVLEKEVNTRSDNFLLVYEVYRKIDWNITQLRFCEVMTLHKDYGLPSFETIVRCRRKLQADYPNLNPPEEVQDARINKTGEYIDYAIDGYQSSFMDFIDMEE